jgi:hypothetical protein
MTERLTPEHVAEIRDEMKRRLTDYGPSALRWPERKVIALLDELDAVTRERDDAYRRVMEFTGAPTTDEAIEVIAEPVEWDAIASYHGITISLKDEGRSPGLDWISEHGGS